MRHGFVRTILIASLIIALEAIELVRLWSTQHASDADRFGEVNQQHYISYGEKLVDPVALFTLALVVSTLLLWQSTDKLWKAGERQIEVAEKSALAAIEAATATRDAVIVSTRPWLKVKADVGHQPFIVAPIGATYSVSIAFDNVGNAPAVNVSPNAWMFVWRNEFGMDPQTQHFRKCEDARLSPPNDNFTLFPSEKFPLSIGYGSYQLGVHVTRDDIDLAIAAGSATDNEGRPVLLFFVGGCVTYSFQSDPKKRHQTQFLMEIRQRDGRAIAANDGVTAPNLVVLQETRWGNIAD